MSTVLDWPALLRVGRAGGSAPRPNGPFDLGPALRYRQGRYAEAAKLAGPQPTTACDSFFLGPGPLASAWQTRAAEDELRKEAEGLILGKK